MTVWQTFMGLFWPVIRSAINYLASHHILIRAVVGLAECLGHLLILDAAAAVAVKLGEERLDVVVNLLVLLIAGDVVQVLDRLADVLQRIACNILPVGALVPTPRIRP